MTLPYILLGLFILFSYTAEAVTGFGSIVIALSLGAMFFPIEWLQTVLVPLNIFLSGFLALKHRAHIDWALLGRLILPFMVIGTLAGTVLQPVLAGRTLKLLFAGLVLWFAVRELLKLRGGIVPRAKSGWWSRSIITGAGITHGLFASGGPLLVYGLAGMQLDKARFRATLILVWFALNSMLTVVFLAQGRLQAVWLPVLAYLPLVPLGVVIGERLHHRIDEQGFRVWIYSLLTVAALALMVGSLLY